MYENPIIRPSKALEKSYESPIRGVESDRKNLLHETRPRALVLLRRASSAGMPEL